MVQMANSITATQTFLPGSDKCTFIKWSQMNQQIIRMLQ